jgi:uncharacterized protein
MLAFVIVGLVLLTFTALNVCAYRALRAFHPRRTTAIRAATIIGNLFWLGLPLMILARQSDIVRYTRSIFAPPWFSWLIFIILYSAFVGLLAVAWLPFMRRIRFAQFGRWPSTILLGLLGVLTVFGVYDALVPLRVREVPVQVDGLPESLEGTRIALMSDLHVGMFSRVSRIQSIARRAAEARPDFIVAAGDLIDDDPFYVPKFLRAFEQIPPELPIYAVLGNHEIYVNPMDVVRRFRAQQRVQLLVNEGTTFRRGDGTLWLAGISDYAARDRGMGGIPEELKPDLPRALDGRPPAAFPILLAHQPKAFADAKAAGIALTLCGHSHGGQFGFHNLGWSLAGVFIPYHMGLYREGRHQLYVCTGAGYWVVPFRLGLPPEIVIIELRTRK